MDQQKTGRCNFALDEKTLAKLNELERRARKRQIEWDKGFTWRRIKPRHIRKREAREAREAQSQEQVKPGGRQFGRRAIHINRWTSQNGLCFYCQEQIPSDQITLDHKIPKSKGGKRGGNLVASCWKCNQKKGNLSAEEFNKIQPAS